MGDDLVLSKIEEIIYYIRNQKVMLDSDLARLYGVETKRLNEQVKRNLDRFPSDFMFELTQQEWRELQTTIQMENYGRLRRAPFVFTENGVAMLSSVLNSSKAIQVNISIMRIFTKLRSFLLLESQMYDRMNKIEDDTNKIFKTVFERLDSLEEEITPHLPRNRKKIGLNKKNG